MKRIWLRTLGLALLFGVSACSVDNAQQQSLGVAQIRPGPGVEQEIWEEPMTDVIDVPPGLDPEGHYYRPGHEEVVEIRQGRWKYQKAHENQ